MDVVAIVGGQYGDEGKGKFVHYLVHDKDIRLVVRANGGCNAGHNVYDPERGVALALHLIPSGIFGKNTVNIVGDGTVVNPHNLVEEIATVEASGVKLTAKNLLLSSRAHVTFQTQRNIDGATDKVGSTAQGIGPTYRDKAARSGLRLEVFLRDDWQTTVSDFLATQNNELKFLGREDLVVDLKTEVSKLKKSIKRLLPHITDTMTYINDQISQNKSLLLEGAQATMLDINYGTYPFVTSSNTTAAGLAVGSGIAPHRVSKVIGVFKLPMTRVGKGPFVTRLTDAETDIHNKLAGIKGSKGAEFGATTGRARDIGWLDLVMARYANRINGFTDLGLTKLDMLSGIKKLKICTAYNLDGNKIADMPADSSVIERCQPEYTEFDGWDEDISGVTNFSKLPKNAQKYIEFIENYVGVPVTMIGTGPDNADLIKR